MATKPRFRIRSAALAAITTAIFILATAAPTLGDTGSVYFDGNDNAAAGDPAHLFNPAFTGVANVGLGASVMPNLTTGSVNVAIGGRALEANTKGSSNFAAGDRALLSNTIGDANAAAGDEAMFSNTTGDRNLAAGAGALHSNTTGDDNTATGDAAMQSNTTGDANVATGYLALLENTTGSTNVAIGRRAGQNLTTGSDNVDIANPGRDGESGAIRIGDDDQTATFIAGISGKSIAGPAQAVLVNAKGQLGTTAAGSAKASALSAAAGRRLLATVKHQQRQIERLQREVRRHG